MLADGGHVGWVTQLNISSFVRGSGRKGRNHGGILSVTGELETIGARFLTRARATSWLDGVFLFFVRESSLGARSLGCHARLGWGRWCPVWAKGVIGNGATMGPGVAMSSRWTDNAVGIIRRDGCITASICLCRDACGAGESKRTTLETS